MWHRAVGTLGGTGAVALSTGQSRSMHLDWPVLSAWQRGLQDTELLAGAACCTSAKGNMQL